MIARAALVSLLLATASAAAGLALAGAWQLGVAAVALGGLGLVGQRRRRDGLTLLAFCGFIVLAALGVGLRAGAVWAPFCLTAALVAWDLDRFAGRLIAGRSRPPTGGNGAGATDATADLERRHLARLGGVAGLGLALSWAGQAIHVKLDLTVMLILGLVAILGLSRAVRLLVRESD